MQRYSQNVDGVRVQNSTVFALSNAGGVGVFSLADPMHTKLASLTASQREDVVSMVAAALNNDLGPGFLSLSDGDFFAIEFTASVVVKYKYQYFSQVVFDFDRRSGAGDRGSVSFVIRGNFDAGFEVIKATCASCRAVVRVGGHSIQCQQIDDEGEYKDRLKRLAWAGVALLMLDVRTALLLTRVPTDDLEQSFVLLAKDEVLATQFKKMMEDYSSLVRYQPAGYSVRQLALAFKANYSGPFRDVYIGLRYPMMPRSVFVGCDRHVTGYYDAPWDLAGRPV